MMIVSYMGGFSKNDGQRHMTLADVHLDIKRVVDYTAISTIFGVKYSTVEAIEFKWL